jgi:hypothetical protein
LGVHSPPQQRFGFQDLELPRPLRVRTAQTLVFPAGFLLTLFEITVQKSLIGVLKFRLQAVATVTRQPAGEDQANEKT